MSDTTSSDTITIGSTRIDMEQTAGTDGRGDRGAILPMILVFVVLGSMLGVALLGFGSTLIGSQRKVADRDEAFLSTKSAMEMAIALQRQQGPDGCIADRTVTINGRAATIQCSEGTYIGSARDRLGVITTSNDPAFNNFAGLGAGAEAKPVSGDVFVNAGSFGVTSTDLALSGAVVTSASATTATPGARYNGALGAPVECSDPAVAASIAAAHSTSSFACESAAWNQYAGDSLTVGGAKQYPTLPPVPTYRRDSLPQANIGSCRIYFPGRYTSPLVLGPGQHYFASGVYYFGAEVVLKPGAEVVGGDGRWIGCTSDAEAVFDDEAPPSSEVTGRGVTFLFGGTAKLSVTNASLRMNRRSSDVTNRASEAVAIRSVNFAAAPIGPQPTEIPNDLVLISPTFDPANTACDPALSTDRCLQPAATHRVLLGAGSEARYDKSALGIGDVIVNIDQTAGTSQTNQVIIDGYVFVPNARVQLNGASNGDYRLRMTGGVVASSFAALYTQTPAGFDWFVGVIDEPIQRQVTLRVTMTGTDGRLTTSAATVEVNANGRYAINSWAIDG